MDIIKKLFFKRNCIIWKGNLNTFLCLFNNSSEGWTSTFRECPSLPIFETLLVPSGIMCIANGTVENVSKYFFYAQQVVIY